MRHIKAHGKIRRVIINTVKHRILKQYPSYEIYEDGTVIRKEHTSYNGYKLKRVKITPYIAHNRYLVVNLHDTKEIGKPITSIVLYGRLSMARFQRVLKWHMRTATVRTAS